MVSNNNVSGSDRPEGEVGEALIDVEVVYALADEQYFMPLSVRKGSTALAAVMASGVTSKYPELNIQEASMGIFSKALDGRHLPLPKDYVLKHRDRVGIYRPLLLDPKQARLERAKKAARLGVRQKVRNKKKTRKTAQE